VDLIGDPKGDGDRTFKLSSGTTFEYGRYVESLGDPVTDQKHQAEDDRSRHETFPPFRTPSIGGAENAACFAFLRMTQEKSCDGHSGFLRHYQVSRL
jgi:hypothetical protein